MVDEQNLIRIVHDLGAKTSAEDLFSWVEDAIESPPYISEGNRFFLLDKAKNILESGDDHTATLLVRCLCTSNPKPSFEPFQYTGIPPVDDIKKNHERWEWIREQEHYLMHVLKVWRLIDDDERVILSDLAKTFFGSFNLHRSGRLILTDRRVIAFGELLGPIFKNEPSYRPVYEGWQQYPFLQSYDFVTLDCIKSVNSIWKRTAKKIELDTYLRYVKEKGRTIYGPYFFKFDLPSTIVEEEGHLKVDIEISDLPTQGFPKEWRKDRQELLARLLADRMGPEIT